MRASGGTNGRTDGRARARQKCKNAANSRIHLHVWLTIGRVWFQTRDTTACGDDSDRFRLRAERFAGRDRSPRLRRSREDALSKRVGRRPPTRATRSAPLSDRGATSRNEFLWVHAINIRQQSVRRHIAVRSVGRSVCTVCTAGNEV